MSESEKSEESLENVIEFDLPQHVLEKYDLEQQVQLIKGYRLLQVLLYYESNKPFFEKPDNDVLGTKRYYDIIENPMWLFEVKRKFFNAEYQSLFEVIKDIRLIFENCYYFWGPRALLTEQCLRMERQFESQVSQLPKDLKSLCTLDKTHGHCDPIANRVWNHCKNRGKSCSNLMLRTWRRRRQHESESYKQKSNISNFCDHSKQLRRWETDVLLLSDDCSSIFSMQELPEIGLFLQLIRSQFDVGPFCQCEIERMLLMPQYSSLFQKVACILLNVTEDEQLDYKDLHDKLAERVSQWYASFETACDDHERLQDFQNAGIDPDFFESVGRSNPFGGSRMFEAFSFYQKVIIIRALCDDWIRQRPAVNELIMNTSEADSPVQKLGRDKQGYAYVYCSRFLDFRLYKLQIQDDRLSRTEADECNTENDSNQLPLKHLFVGNAVVTDCELKADTLEQLRSFIDELYYSDLESAKKDGKEPQSMLVQALLKLDADLHSKEEEFIRLSNECRIRLFKEWREGSKCDEPLITDDVYDEEVEPTENGGAGHAEEKDSQDEDDEDEDERDEEEAERLVATEQVTKDKCDADAEQIETSHGSAEEESNFENQKSEQENYSSFETSEERRGKKRKKKKKKKKKKRKSREYEEAEERVEMNESFTEELHDIVKEEPLDEEERNNEAADANEEVEVKTEIKEEPSNFDSNGLGNSRRRRSSVPSYSVYQNDMFSDEEDSAEEMFTSEEDSDDEWEIPCKRSKNKKNKANKQFRATTTLVKSEGSNYSIRRKESPQRQTSIDDSKSTTDSRESSPQPDLNLVPEVIIKEEDIKTEKCDEPATSEKMTNVRTEKPVQKIKVIDFAKLMNSSTASTSSSMQTLRPIVPSSTRNSSAGYAVRPTRGVNPMSVMRAAFSRPQQPNMYMSQPMMRNAYVIASPNNQQQPYGLANSNPITAGYLSGRTMQPTVTPRIVRAQSINPACVNQKATFKQALPQPNHAQMMRMPMKQPTKSNKLVYVNPVTVPRNLNTPYTAPFSNNYTPLQKIGRNVTVEAKPMQRRQGVREIEGTIGIHSTSGGVLQYVVNLANGSHVPLSADQVQKLREGNNGNLPTKLKIPVPVDVAEKIEPFVVIDD